MDTEAITKELPSEEMKLTLRELTGIREENKKDSADRIHRQVVE